MAAILFSILATAALALPAPTTNVTVNTTFGPVLGRSDNSGAIFLGIPFAAPPIGNRRFRPPTAPAPWKEPLPVLKPLVCLQQLPPAPPIGTENCLGLDIWAPPGFEQKTSAPGGGFAVLAWIHGGGFELEDPNDHVLNFTHLAARAARDEPVVFVRIKYRLGGLGFLASKHLAAESGAHGGSGNYGVLDQIFALRWIQDNIAAFGGDPRRVTVAGESAGAYSISVLLASPLASGLFSKAIIQSTYTGLLYRSHARAVALSGTPCEALHCANSTGNASHDVAACLRALPAIDAYRCIPQLLIPKNSTAWPSSSLLLPLTLPNVDGHVLRCDPRTAHAHPKRCGNAWSTNVSVLIGSNEREADLFAFWLTPPFADIAAIATSTELVTRVLKPFPGRYASFYSGKSAGGKNAMLTQAQADMLLDLYPASEYAPVAEQLQRYFFSGNNSGTSRWTTQGALALGMLTDVWMTCTTQWVAEAFAKNAEGGGGGGSHRYLLTLVASSQPRVALLGPMHSLDMPLLFGTFNEYAEEMGFGNWTAPGEDELRASAIVQDAWLSFTTGRGASASSSSPWPAWPAMLNISGTAVVQEGVGKEAWHAEQCAFWDAVLN